MTPRVALVPLLLCLGCASNIEVRGGGHDPHYDFTKVRTYAWTPRETLGDPRIDEALLEERVHEAVDQELAGKGFRLAEPAQADVLVGYRAVLGRSRRQGPGAGTTEYAGIWTDDYTPRDATGGSSTVDRMVYEGTLVLRIQDRASGHLVWEATAETDINPRRSSESERREEKIRRAIRAMLGTFPP